VIVNTFTINYNYFCLTDWVYLIPYTHPYLLGYTSSFVISLSLDYAFLTKFVGQF